MNGKYHCRCIGRVFGILISISTALTGCGGSNSGIVSNATADGSSPSNNGTSGTSSTMPPASSDSVTISWTAPSENTDGSALTNLAGYEIYYGTSPSALTQQISINTVGIMDYVVGNLSSGTWYFEVVAVNSAGEQSAPTSLVSTTI
jgi:hypothetical protein